MCFGHDGDGALEHSLAAKGASRRGLLKGAAGAAAGAAALGAATASPAAAGSAKGAVNGRGGGKHVPHDKVSIQLYTLRSAAAVPAPTRPAAIGHVATLQAVARYGYPRVELAGLYGETAAGMRAILDG